METEVTKEEFWNCVNTHKEDVISNIINPYSYPYTSRFSTRYANKEVGKIVDYHAEGTVWPVLSRYYLVK